MSKFTEDEKIILRNLPKEYKYIARDKDGMIYVYDMLPTRLYSRFALKGIWRSLSVFENIFKGVTWENSPICFREPVLDDEEREYLKTVLKPFRDKIVSVKKRLSCISYDDEFVKKYEEFIDVQIGNNHMWFPNFESRTMYKGMKAGKEYTLEQLGITY